MLAYYHRKMVGDPMTKTKPKVNALNLAPQENIDIENSCHLFQTPMFVLGHL